jgi:hypothetical protein
MFDTIAYTYESLLSGGRSLTCCGNLLLRGEGGGKTEVRSQRRRMCGALPCSRRSYRPGREFWRLQRRLLGSIHASIVAAAHDGAGVLRSPGSFTGEGRAQENATMK